LGDSCGLICCPNCGYQVVDVSRTRMASLLGRLWRGRGPVPGSVVTAPEEGAIPLTHVPTRIEVEVRSLQRMPPGRSARLSAFGLAPGSRVSVVQRRPVPVIRLGETELAVSEEILEEIWVEAPKAARTA
jgi:Fe2+ transport system protein FeoA